MHRARLNRNDSLELIPRERKILNMIKEIELAVCPFCEGEAEITKRNEYDLFVTCKKCHISIGPFSVLALAIKVWNTRFPELERVDVGEIKRIIRKYYKAEGAEHDHNRKYMAIKIADKIN